MDLNRRFWTIVAAVGPALIVAAFAIVVVDLMNSIAATHAAETRTTSILNSTTSVLAIARASEASQHAYLLTGREAAIQPFRATPARLSREFNALGRLTANHPELRRQVILLRQAVNTDMRNLSALVAIQDNMGRDVALARTQQRWPERTDELSWRAKELQLQARSALQVESDRGRRAMRTGMTVLLVGSLLAGLLSILVVVLFSAYSEAQLNQERRFRALIEHAPDMVLLLAPNGTLKYSSPAVMRVLGYQASDHGEWNAVEAVHPDDLDIARRALQQVLRTPGEIVESEFRIRHKQGGWRNMQIWSRNLVQDPEVAGIVINGRDITATRAVEHQLQHAQKMEAVGRLAAGVAHDFNNVLTAIRGYSELLLAQLENHAEIRADAEEVRDAAIRGSALTKQLLLFSSREITQPKVVSVGKTISNIERMLRRLLGADIELAITVPPEDDAWVHLDPTQLEQVMMNLVVNARDAIPAGGTVDVEISSANDSVQIIVRDSGHGIDHESLPHIFEPFFTTKAKHVGTGLGLANVHRIVQHARGTITVTSSPGEGAEFVVTLPRVSPPQDKPVQASPLPEVPVSRGETILLAEDDAAVRRLAARLLRQQGHRVIEARDGMEALAIAAHEEVIDLLVTDLVMPELGGIELMQRLKAERPDLNVLLISGYTEDEIARRGISEAQFPFLSKPFTGVDLLAAVQSVLQPAA